MTNNTMNKWTIDVKAFEAWLNNREEEFEPALDPVPTLKALVFLALLDKGAPCTYEELGTIFEERGVVSGSVPLASLRVAMSELGNVLTRTKHRLQVQAFKVGQRESKFQLITRVQKCGPNITNNVVLINEPQSEKAGEIAEALIEKQTLPFHSLYYLPRSACWWVNFSTEEAEYRKYYEADTWEELGLYELVAAASSSSSVVGMVGLAIGEGLGEIELMRKMLTDGYTVHYLAVDLSPVLLVAHIETVREAFSNELKEGRLICAGILVNVFLDLNNALAQARAEFKARGTFARDEEFIPPDCAIVATFLGNCLGNDENIKEDTIFDTVCKVFPENNPLAILVGVSIMRSEPDAYTRTWDDFLLQTPLHLLQTLGILRSRQPLVNESEAGFIPPTEFVLPPDTIEDEYSAERQSCRLRRCPPVEINDYSGPRGIKGQIYRFNYYLDYALEISSDKRQLPAHSEIVLYSIIKYNMESLIRGIEKRQFKVKYRSDYHKLIETENGSREYGVFIAYRNRKEDS